MDSNPKQNFLDLLRDKFTWLLGRAKQLASNPRVRVVLDKGYTRGRTIWLAAEAWLPAKIRPFVEKNRRKVALALGAIFLVVFIRQCGALGRRTSTKLAEEVAAGGKATSEATLPVKVFKVARFNYEDTLNALGTIKGAMEFKLSFEVPGVISSINYREGERYEEGALLISLRQDDILLRLKRAQAEMNKAEAESGIAQRKYDDQKKVFEIGGIPQSTLVNPKLEFD